MAKRKTLEEIEAEQDANLVPAVLEPITPLQQTLLDALLSGKSITEACAVTGIPRRTVTRWLSQSTHPVRVEYEKQRLSMVQQFRQRIGAIHDKALAAIEAALSESAPLALRFAAGKFLYEQNLQEFCNVVWPNDSAQLVKDEVDLERYGRFDGSSTYLNLIAD
jgi:hypothetical protein